MRAWPDVNARIAHKYLAMTTAIPNTGSTIKLGSVYNAYYVASPSGSPAAGTNVQLSAKLAGNVSITVGTIILLSRNFGGRTGPYNYTPP